ncbi:MAG: HPF/RaiA family ribosome-associated protein [Acidobacteria bacterium]|nr:HPF/RaiA family ribosome-associated protein [Acidobacteriota bacterium]
MQILMTGKTQEFSAEQAKKLAARYAKVSKLVDGRKEGDGEKGLHVIFSSQRHLTRAEATLNYMHHSAVGHATDADPYKALCGSLEKLEKQVVKLRTKWRDVGRNGHLAVPEVPVEKAKAAKKAPAAAKVAAKAPAPEAAEGTQVRRVTVGSRRKPMTAEEALLTIRPRDLYLAYRDADSDKICVLIRRNDGEFDLIEG